MGDRIGRRIRTAGTVRVDPPDPRARRERAANSVDRYSLVLQLVQVFPIISGAAVVLVTTTWVARAFSAVGLIAGALWVLRLERSGAMGSPRHRDAADTPPQSVVPVRRGDVPEQTAAVVLTDVSRPQDGTVLTEVVCEYREINISIRLRPTPKPEPTAARRRERRLRRRVTRGHPAALRGDERAALERGDERTVREREISPRRSWTSPVDCVGVHEPQPSSYGGGID